MTSRRPSHTGEPSANQGRIFVNDNERVASLVAAAVVGLVICEAVVLPGAANALVQALTGLLPALALLVDALRRK
jgi:hypothetical protein